MQGITRIALGLGAAALVASGGSAFTAASSVTESGTRLGHGSHSVTGVAVSNVEYVSGTPDIITNIIFTVAASSAELTSLDLAQLYTNGTSTPVDADCDVDYVANGGTGKLINCTANVTANSINSVHLVVKPR